MVIAIESLLFLLAGIVLAVVLARVFGKPAAARTEDAGALPVVKLVRSSRTPEGHEETRLFLNGQIILTAANDGVRLAQYADEVEQLEALAARLAAALGVAVAFERVGPRNAAPEADPAVRNLPKISPDEIDAEERRKRLRQEEA